MPYRSPPNRAKEYRRLAEECRSEANAMEDAACRKAMRDTADTWESLADYEPVEPILARAGAGMGGMKHRESPSLKIVQ